MIKPTGSLGGKSGIFLRDYMQAISPTDKLPPDDLHSVQMGLFGEVGSIMATAKKFRREKEAYLGFQNEVEEEFGDVLWYFTAICRRLGVGVDEIFSDASAGDDYNTIIAASDLPIGPVSYNGSPPFNETLLALGRAAATILQIDTLDEGVRNSLVAFADQYLRALQNSKLAFAQVANRNIEKACGRFLEPDRSLLPTFDDDYHEDEQLPGKIEINFTQRTSGQCYLRWNGVFLGDALTDNIKNPDGYRFHDAFHIAHAAILHWSPVFRALIKHKRKSRPKIDEAQDGGRAIVIEEGLSAWIFSRAKQMNFFVGQKSLSFDLLKTVRQFVQGYEVEACPLSLWEHAILQGYTVFRQLLKYNGGTVIGNRDTRTVTYIPLKEK